jgi:hypothetical protein
MLRALVTVQPERPSAASPASIAARPKPATEKSPANENTARIPPPEGGAGAAAARQDGNEIADGRENQGHCSQRERQVGGQLRRRPTRDEQYAGHNQRQQGRNGEQGQERGVWHGAIV